MPDLLDEPFFYELMQDYRNVSRFDQSAVVAAYEAVKEYIRENFTPDDTEA